MTSLSGGSLEHFIKTLFSLSNDEIEEHINHNLVFMDESSRVELYGELMQMAADLLENEASNDSKIAERAEFIAGFINPFDDHKLRGLIRFNTLALDESSEKQGLPLH
jgi:hypothetical protein